jgi:DNA-binding response OmpR family regulator
MLPALVRQLWRALKTEETVLVQEPRKRILLFGSPPHMVELVRINLQREGYDLHATGSLLEAIAILRSRKMAAVLLDDAAGAEDVSALLREARTHWPVYCIPLILMAYDDGFIGEEVREYTSDWLQKPFSPKLLIRMLHAWLEPKPTGIIIQ